MTNLSNQRALRDAFGCFATGVTIVTSLGPDGAPIGFTANSFSSVSLDPPLLLVCPDKRASSLPAIRAAGRFGVNVLASHQRPISERFARRGVHRFAEGQWTPDTGGIPMLEEACANFSCLLEADVDAGDHVILVGRITGFRAAPNRAPLMYLRGCYATPGQPPLAPPPAP